MTQRIDSLDARLLRGIAALAVISAACALLSTAPAFSAPMRCSGEEKICIAACKKEPQPVVDIDLPDQLRAAPVGVHEVRLLEQRPAKILRASQTIERPSPRRHRAFTNS